MTVLPMIGPFCSLFAGSIRRAIEHSIEKYVRYEDGEAVHASKADGYFSTFKCGMRDVYQHCKEKHVHRYLAECDFHFITASRLALMIVSVRHLP